jgi:hypothetical protein
MKCTRCTAEKSAAAFKEGDRTFRQCGPCRSTERARAKANYEKDPGKQISRIKRWRKKNLAKVRANSRLKAQRYRQAHPEKKAAENRSWNRRNKGKRAAHSRAYQLTKRRAMPKWADRGAIELIYLLAQQLREEGFDVHVDHQIPLRGKGVCGLHVDNNLQIVPKRYNLKKHNKTKP